MARIFYSVAGEGRGHATRTRALVEQLRHEHEVVLFASGEAHDLLRLCYRGSTVKLHRIPGLRFHYHKHTLAYVRTGRMAFRFLRQLPRLLRFFSELLRRSRPELVITDFEPALPRAARRCGIPFVSLDHQHLLTCCDLSGLPLWLRWRAWGLGAVVNAFYSGQAETIVSSFYSPPLRRGVTRTTRIGVLLRPEILDTPRDQGPHLLTYLRRDVPARVLEVLAGCGRPVEVYGLGERPASGSLRFHAVSEGGFLRDLASCQAVISTAGNQLVGEALYLGKPVLALPEQRNFEQYVNAHLLAQSRAGAWCDMDHFNPVVLGAFLDRLADYRQHIDPARVNGNPAALAAIRRHLCPLPAPTASLEGVR